MAQVWLCRLPPLSLHRRKARLVKTAFTYFYLGLSGIEFTLICLSFLASSWSGFYSLFDLRYAIRSATTSSKVTGCFAYGFNFPLDSSKCHPPSCTPYGSHQPHQSLLRRVVRSTRGLNVWFRTVFIVPLFWASIFLEYLLNSIADSTSLGYFSSILSY